MGAMTQDKQEPDPQPAAEAEIVPRGAPRPSLPLTKLNRPQRPFSDKAVEDGGPSGPEPTRFNDWERKGRVSDF